MSWTVRYDKTTGEIDLLSAIDPPEADDLVAETLPEMPAPDILGKRIPELRVVDGALAWVMVHHPEAPGPDDPAPEPEERTPTHAEVEQARQAAYRERVDPLTAEISRLRDMAPEDPRIAEAEAEREAAVARVVAENPYPEEKETP